jgi:hypothetical protein
VQDGLIIGKAITCHIKVEKFLKIDFLADYLGREDLIIKGKFTFWNGNMVIKIFIQKFSGKTKIDNDKSLTVKSDYMLTHTYSPWTKYLISHKSDQSISLDGNFGLWAEDKSNLSLYANSTLQNDKNRWNNKLQLRFQHEDDKAVSIGVEDWDILSKDCCPEIISAWGIWGFKTDEWRPFVGVGAGLNTQTKAIAYHKYLVGLKQMDWSLYVQLHALKAWGTWKQEASIIFDHRINKDIKVSADIKADVKGVDRAQLVLVGEYRVDVDTFIKARVSLDQSLTFSFTKNYRKLINFCFITKVILYII